MLLGVGNIFGVGPLSINEIDSTIIGYSFATNITGMDASRLSFTDSSFSVNFDTLSIYAGEYLDIDLQFSSAVPEPDSLALFALGLVALLVPAMRKNRG